jgi:hypothetical protein
MRSRALERKTAGKHRGPLGASGPPRHAQTHPLLRLQRTVGNQAVVRALLRSGRRSTAPLLRGPLLQRDDWDFTPADYTALVKQKKNLRFEADSAWFPKPLQENLCRTLIFALTATNPARTEGINVSDFYHGHILVKRGKKTEELSKKIVEFEAKADELQGKALGGKSFDPVTTKNIGAYTKAMQETEKLATPILEEVVKIEGAAVIYHTFEYSGPKMNPGSPIRNILTPIGGTPAGYDPSGTEKSASQYADEYDYILQFAFLVDENGVVHVTIGTTPNLSRVTGTPIKL